MKQEDYEVFKAYLAIFILCILVAGDVVAEQNPGIGTITGRVMIKQGGPIADGVVYFFNKASGPPPLVGKYWRVPDNSVRTDSDGRFTAKLVEGTYFIGAIKRNTDERMGIPKEGDIVLPSHDKKGKQRVYVVKKGETTNAGTIAEASVYSEKNTTIKASRTAIAGTVTDESGQPVEGIAVFAYLSPAMTGIPLFVSERTGKDGKYILRVHKGGTYYIKIRNFYGGGAPEDIGEIMGGHGQQGQPEPVAVITGKITRDIDVRGRRFTGRGPKPKEEE